MMKRALLLGGLALGVLVLGVLLYPRPKTAPPQRLPTYTPTPALGRAALRVAQPIMQWRPNAQAPWQNAASVQIALEGDELRTDATGGGEISLSDDTHIILLPNSHLQLITLRREHAAINLLAGRYQHTVGAWGGYEVSTPALERITANRAVFTLWVSPNGQTRLEVLQGEVTAQARGESQMISAGFMVNVLPGQRVQNPALIPSATPSPTNTATLTPSPTNTPTLTPTNTSTPTLTPTNTSTATLTPTNTSTPTLPPSPTNTATLTPTDPNLTNPSPTATATPIATNTPRQVSQTAAGVCTALVNYPNGLRVRAGPGMDYQRIGFLADGEQITILGQSLTGNWYRVQHPSLPAGGWMASNLLAPAPDCPRYLPLAP